MAAHPAGGAALGGVLAERGDLDRSRLGARAAPSTSPHAVTTTDVVAVDGAEPGDLLARGELDAGHAAAAAALRADAGGAEVEQLGVGGDEAELLVAGARARRRRRPRRRP